MRALLVVWSAVLGLAAAPALADVEGLVKRLDDLDPTRRAVAFWTLVQRPGALPKLAVWAREAGRSAQSRWALERVIYFRKRGYNRVSYTLAGDYLAGLETLPWRQRQRTLERYARICGTSALPALNKAYEAETVATSKRAIKRLRAGLELLALQPSINALMRADPPKVEPAVAKLKALLGRFPDEPEVHYELASIYALGNKTDEALGALADAIAKGFDDSQRLDHDTDLESIRAHPRFARLKRSIK